MRHGSLCVTLHNQPWVIGGKNSETSPLSGSKFPEVNRKVITEEADLQIDVLLPVFQIKVSQKNPFLAVSGLTRNSLC